MAPQQIQQLIAKFITQPNRAQRVGQGSGRHPCPGCVPAGAAWCAGLRPIGGLRPAQANQVPAAGGQKVTWKSWRGWIGARRWGRPEKLVNWSTAPLH